MKNAHSALIWLRLKPRGYGDLGVEEFEDFYSRVAGVVPNVPVEILNDWIYRHYDDAVRVFGWLELTQLQFQKQEWTTHQIVSQVRACNEKLVENWKVAYRDGGRAGQPFRQSKLGKFMRVQGTWPLAPLIMPNPITPDNFGSQWPLLVEGHHRLAYLRALYESQEETLLSHHWVWLVSDSAIT